MGVQNLSSELEGFLYGFFHQAANDFTIKAQKLQPGPAKTEASALAFDFTRASGAARSGRLPQLNEEIDGLVKKVSGITDPDLKETVEDLRLQQKLFFRHVTPQEKADLGTYSNGIF